MANALSRNETLLFGISTYESDLENRILSGENYDREYHILKEKTVKNEQNQVKTDFILNKQGPLLPKNKLYIPNITETKLIVMNELHKQLYSGHSGY